MNFKTTDLDTKIKEIAGCIVNHEKTLREQIVEDELRFKLKHANLDSFGEDELNIHIDYLEHLRSVEVG